MRGIKKLLNGNGNNIMTKSAIWNIVSSMEYSLQSAILLLVVTRAGGLFDAGVFTIAYTLTQMMVTIGNYGMRSFQVSDVREEYKFGTYLCSRTISVVAMLIICISYSLLQGYDNEKVILIMLLCMYRVVDSVEDVFHGEIQKKMRLDVAAKIVSVRIFVATLMFVLTYVLTRNLITASLVLTVTAIFVSFVLNYIVVSDFQNITLKMSKERVTNLLWACLPIGVSGFLYNYLANAPKYAIDRNLSEETQTIFSILFMPIFVINILSGFIFKPMIANMGVTWNIGKTKVFVKTVIKQLILVIVLTVFIMICGALCGVNILGWMYGVDLIKYRALFIMLLAFGGFAAVAAFLEVVLTIVRKQKYIIVAYGISTLVNLIFADQVVIRYEIWGAGIMYGITMGIIVLLLTLTFLLTLWNGRKKCRK